jgi:hypothetical protein
MRLQPQAVQPFEIGPQLGAVERNLDLFRHARSIQAHLGVPRGESTIE